jgi:large subunit ribosomal protein LP2
MKHIAAYLLATLGGNESPKAKDVSKILESVGIEADQDRLNTLLKELEGKSIDELIAQGSSKLASMPSGGAAAPASGSAPAAAAAAPKEEKKKEEAKEESDDDMGFGLFD